MIKFAKRNYKQLTSRVLKRGIKRVGKKLRMVHTEERKDFAKNKDVEKVVNKKKEEFYNIKSRDKFQRLSDVDKADADYVVFDPDHETLNRYLKDTANEKMDDPFRKILMYEINQDPLMSEPAQIQNEINAQEWEKYRIDFYEKNETKRLLEEQEFDQDNVLARFKGYKGDNQKIQEKIFDRLDVIDYQLNERPQKAIEFNPYNDYLQQIEEMRDDKIRDLIDFENKNEKLTKLVESGFLDRRKSLVEVVKMMKLADEKARGYEQGGSRRDGEEEYIVIGSDGEEPRAAEERGDMQVIGNQFTQIAKTNEDRELLAIVLGTQPSLESQGGLQYNAKYSEIYYYLRDFIKTDEETRIAVQESVEKMAVIRDYEESLFENKHLASLEKRGEPTFSKLDEEERVAYIKHHVNHFDQVFDIVSVFQEELTKDKQLPRALVEKLALTHSIKDMFYKDNDYLDLATISREEYKTLFKITMNHLHTYSFKELSQVLYSLGELHKREAGQLMPELYVKGLQKTLLVTNTVMDKVHEILTSDEFVDEQTKSSIVRTLGVCLEGILKLGMVNNSLPDAFMKNSIEVVNVAVPYIKEGYTMNRITEFTLKMSKIRGINMKTDLQRILTPILAMTPALSSMMIKADLNSLVINLNSLVRQNHVLNIERGLIKQAVESIKEPMMVRYKEQVTVRELERFSTLMTASNSFDHKTKGVMMKIVDKRVTRGVVLVNESLPKIFQNMAITDLRLSNEYYNECEELLDVIFLKSVVRVKAFEIQNSRKFDFYNRMLEKSLTMPESMTEKDVINYMNGICLTDNKIDPFKLQMLDIAVEEILQKEFNLKLVSRMVLVYQSQGVENSKNKWLRISKERMTKEMTPNQIDSTSLLTLILIDDELDLKIEFLSFILKPRLQFFSTSYLTLLLWKVSLYPDNFVTLKNSIHDVLEQKEMSEFKKLDFILMTQIPHKDTQGSLLIPERISEYLNTNEEFEISLINFFREVISSDPSITVANASKAYNKLAMTLQRSKVRYQSDKILTSETGQMAYFPILTIQNKSAFFVYNDYFFLKNLKISQDEHMDFNYSYTIGKKRPEFLRRNEEILEESGVGVRSLRLRDFEMISSYSDSDFGESTDKAIDRQRLKVMGITA